MQLGKIGIWTTYHHIGEESAGEAARIVEECGFGTLWLGFSPRLFQLRPLLESTERLIVGTSIVNIWEYEPEQLATEFAELQRDFPDRAMVGIGVGHPEEVSRFTKPLTAMSTFLDGLDAAPEPIPANRRCLAALGPKMLDLAGRRAAGAIPYFTPVDHTASARSRLGPDALLAPELACVVDPDPATSSSTAREYAADYLELHNYTANLGRFGFSDEEFDGGGSDRLLKALIARGTAAEIASTVCAHLDAGADHVAVQAVGANLIPVDQWRALAAELLD